jgi:hypothetical protein
MWLTMFFKVQDNELLKVEPMVCDGETQLFEELKDDYTYPVNGWYWFSTEAEAKSFFNLE